eukprot:Amastigsp_a508836_23.p2 type:complete len:388 gc:universal Amastigsp_a508836_23:1510-347(-)
MVARRADRARRCRGYGFCGGQLGGLERFGHEPLGLALAVDFVGLVADDHREVHQRRNEVEVKNGVGERAHARVGEPIRVRDGSDGEGHAEEHVERHLDVVVQGKEVRHKPCLDDKCGHKGRPEPGEHEQLPLGRVESDRNHRSALDKLEKLKVVEPPPVRLKQRARNEQRVRLVEFVTHGHEAPQRHQRKPDDVQNQRCDRHGEVGQPLAAVARLAQIRVEAPRPVGQTRAVKALESESTHRNVRVEHEERAHALDERQPVSAWHRRAHQKNREPRHDEETQREAENERVLCPIRRHRALGSKEPKVEVENVEDPEQAARGRRPLEIRQRDNAHELQEQRALDKRAREPMLAQRCGLDDAVAVKVHPHREVNERSNACGKHGHDRNQ